MDDQGFDMENYIRQRLAEIKDIDERAFAKEVILKGLLPAFRAMEERYRELEERVEREIQVHTQQFSVKTMVIRRQDYDSTNRTWFPICNEDHCIYFQGDERQRRMFVQEESFQAVDSQGNIHHIGIRRAPGYQAALEELYHVFVYNRIPWNTVNTGHIDRFYEWYPLDGEEDTTDWKVSYGEWEDWLRDDAIAVWNVEKFPFHCTRFMVPSADGKYYEYELDLNDYEKDSGYMVGCNEDILSLRYEEGKIILASLRETFENWTAYRFCCKADMDSYGYQNPILCNCRKAGFADSLIKRQGHGIHSKTEIFRIVENLGVGECIRLADCCIRDREREGSISADMNRFIREEVFPMETRRILELSFRRSEEGEPAELFYMQDMMRYVVSQVQMLLDEYKCVGFLE